MPSGYVNIATNEIEVAPLYAYGITGGIVLAGNLILIAAIFTTKGLQDQKEYIIFATNMIMDALFGFTYLTAAVRRLGIYYGPVGYLEKYSRWDCFKIYHNCLFIFTTAGVGSVAIFTCIDRLLSVQFAAKYLKYGTRYSYGMMAGSFLVCIPLTIIAGITSWMQRDIYDVNSVCMLRDGVTIDVLNLLRIFRIVSSLIVIAIYAYITKKVYKIMASKSRMTSTKKRLVRMTTTVLLITVSQFVMFLLPDIYLLHVVFVLDHSLNNYIYWFYFSNECKGLVNIFIFIFMQRDLIQAILHKLKLGAQRSTVVHIPGATEKSTERTMPHVLI